MIFNSATGIVSGTETFETVRRWMFPPFVPRLSSAFKPEVCRAVTRLEALSVPKA
jgi:hypothetical protein